MNTLIAELFENKKKTLKNRILSSLLADCILLLEGTSSLFKVLQLILPQRLRRGSGEGGEVGGPCPLPSHQGI